MSLLIGHDRHARRCGFTLIELLVTVGIITLLLSILLPVIGLAWRHSQLATCGNNLHQINGAVIAYVHNNGDTLPSASNYEETYSRWGGKAGSYKTTDWPNRLINLYLDHGQSTSNSDNSANVHLFQCPADTGGRAGDWAQDRYPTEFDFWGTSYFYNSSANNNDGTLGLQDKHIGQIKNPTRVVLISDWPFNAHFQNTANFSYMYWHNLAEQGWGNVLFMDGHVRYLHATQNAPDFQNGPDWTFIFNGG